MVDSGDDRAAPADELLALQRAARNRNLFHSVRRLLASEAALSRDLGLPPPSTSGPASVGNATPAELLAASSPPSAARLLELGEALQTAATRAFARVERLDRAHNLLTTGAALLESGQPDKALLSLREAARLVPDSTTIASAIAGAEEASQATFEFATPGGEHERGAPDEAANRRVAEGLARARELADSGRSTDAISLLRDPAMELPSQTDLTDALERYREQNGALPQQDVETGTAPPVIAARPVIEDQPAPARPATLILDSAAASPVTPATSAAEIHTSVKSARPVPPAYRHPMLLAAGIVLCVAAAMFWAVRMRAPRMAGPQTGGRSLQSETATVPETPRQAVAPSRPSPLPADRTEGGTTPNERAAAPIGTSSHARMSHEKPTSTMGGGPSLAGQRLEESLLGRIKSKELERQYAVGKEALGRDDFSQAIAVFSAIVAEEPGFADAASLLETASTGRQERVSRLIDQADRLRQSGDYQLAIGAYQRVLALEPSVPDIAARLSETQRQMEDLGRRAFQYATVAEAYGLDSEARRDYAAAARMLPPQTRDRAVAEARAGAQTGGSSSIGSPWPSPPASRLDLAEVVDELRAYSDEAGRFTFRYPSRRWRVAQGEGSTLLSVTDPDRHASIRIDGIRLKEPLSLTDLGDVVVDVESRLIEDRERGATQIARRLPRPTVPLVILDYRKEGLDGPIRVRQYTSVRNLDLFRLVASAPAETFPLVEGVFDQLARSFAPMAHR